MNCFCIKWHRDNNHGTKHWFFKDLFCSSLQLFVLILSLVQRSDVESEWTVLECTGTLALTDSKCVDNVYSRCARSVWIKNHGTNMQKGVLKALLWTHVNRGVLQRWFRMCFCCFFSVFRLTQLISIVPETPYSTMQQMSGLPFWKLAFSPLLTDSTSKGQTAVFSPQLRLDTPGPRKRIQALTDPRRARIWIQQKNKTCVLKTIFSNMIKCGDNPRNSWW